MRVGLEKVWLEVITLQMQVYRFIHIMIGIIVTDSRLKIKPYLVPPFANPTLRARIQLNLLSVCYNAGLERRRDPSVNVGKRLRSVEH